MTTQAFAARRLRTHLYKACQRCHGDLVLDREVELEALGASSDYVCLQCGRRTPLQVLVEPGVPAIEHRLTTANAA
jgi:hypothetical protein